jgi:hypothetical protein
MRRTTAIGILAGLLLLTFAGAADAVGETVDVLQVDCDGVTIRGEGYTPGQDLLLLARAPQGEGTIAGPVTVQANDDGNAPTTTLKFGGQVPDGTYLAVITTPGPGQREEVTERFQVSGCQALPFTGWGTGSTTAGIIAVGLILAGLLLVRRRPAA